MPLEEGELEVPGPSHHRYNLHVPEFEWPGDDPECTGLNISNLHEWSHSSRGSDSCSFAPSQLLRPGNVSTTAHSSSTRPTPLNDHPIEHGSTECPLRARSASQDCLRFVVLRSGILPSKHRIVLADGFPELQFGRDAASVGTSTPRVRLKEMEVSKLHASVYWDAARKEWGVVDMGSKHGTFVKNIPKGTNYDVTSVEDVGVRISPPRVASMPRVLGHMDRLTIGSTTFVVHIHKDRLPCEGCSPASGEEVPLFATVKPPNHLKRSRTAADLDSPAPITPQKTTNPKAALSMLKRSLLTRHDDAPASTSTTSSRSASPKPYVDRSARRRALHTTSHVDAPGVAPISTALPGATSKVHPSGATSEPISPRAITPEAGPPAPLSHTNIGYRLLMGQGWEPGTALGVTQDDTPEDRTALIEPLQLASSANRAGLGVHTAPGEQPPSTFRRWQEARLASGERA